MSNYKWSVKPKPEAEKVKKLKCELNNIPTPIAEILIQRGVGDFNKAKKFFRPEISELHDPFLMSDMVKASSRVIKAIENEERILIYGDYDVDGTTSVAMMYSFLMKKNKNTSHYIPDRYTEGYGISETGIAYAVDNDFSLIIALDCGIKAHNPIAKAKENGIDVVVCDHHLPGKVLPDAFAILNPKKKNCNYPFKELSGCGVGFKLIQAVVSKLNSDDDVNGFLDLVCISTAADIVNMTGENRILTKYGLQKINENPRAGVKVMVDENKIGNLTISDVVFGMAPRINAAGRISHAKFAVELLLSKNDIIAQNNIKEIEEKNDLRKTLDKSAYEDAIKLIENEKDTFVNIVYNENWHKGILGIVASRIIEKHYKPTIVLSKSNDVELVASARSIKGINIVLALESCSNLLTKYGGHEFAAGFSIPKKNLTKFKFQFNNAVEQQANGKRAKPVLEIDKCLCFKEINSKFIRIHNQLAPFGPGNLNPVFLSKNVLLTKPIRELGKGGEHLQLHVNQIKGGPIFKAVFFNAKEKTSLFSDKFDLVYTLNINHWKGQEELQLMVKDVRKSSDL